MFWMLCSLMHLMGSAGQLVVVQRGSKIGNHGLRVARPRAEQFRLASHAVENLENKKTPPRGGIFNKLGTNVDSLDLGVPVRILPRIPQGLLKPQIK